MGALHQDVLSEIDALQLQNDIRRRDLSQGVKAPKAEQVSVVTQKIRKEELLRLLMAGHNTRKCAELLALSVYTVRNYIRGDKFQEELKLLSQEVWARVDEEIKLTKIGYAQRIDEMADRALSKIADLMESEDEKVVLKAAQDTLDRNPKTSRHHKVDSNVVTFNIDASQLQLAAQAAQELQDRTIEGK